MSRVDNGNVIYVECHRGQMSRADSMSNRTGIRPITVHGVEMKRSQEKGPNDKRRTGCPPTRQTSWQESWARYKPFYNIFFFFCFFSPTI